MLEKTSETAPRPSVLLKIEWDTPNDKHCVQILAESFIVHENLNQSERPHRATEYRYKDLRNVRRDKVWIFADNSAGGKELALIVSPPRKAQHIAGILTVGVRAEPKNFAHRVERARSIYGTDTEVQVRERYPPEYTPEGLIEEHPLRSEADALDLLERLRAYPSLSAEQIRDTSRVLPPMLEANYRLEAGGYISLGADADDGPRWHFCPHDGFHLGQYASSEEHAAQLLRQAVGGTIFVEDRRQHSNIRYLRAAVTILPDSPQTPDDGLAG